MRAVRIASRLSCSVVCLALATSAQAQVDPSAGWRTLHTPHFRIHFRPETRAVAPRAAREAERAYGLLARELHPPRGIIDITLSDDADAANALTTVFPSNRITLYVAPPASDPDLQNYDSWLRVVTTHELTHVFHLDRARGFWGSLQHVFGRGPLLFPNEYQPTWVIEGLATYYESALTNAGRVKGTLHTQVLAAGALGGTARSPWNALFFSRWPGGVAPYAYGSRFFRYLADSLGDSIVPRFVEGTAGQLIPFRVGRPLSRVTPSVRLDAAWPRGTQPAAAPADSSGAERIDRGLFTEPVPRVSPDRRRLAYVRDDGKGRRSLYIVSTEDWRRVRTHDVTGGVSYDWLGDTLIVSQLDYTSRWLLRSDLYRWLPDGRWTRTTRGARLQQPRAGGDRLSTIELVPGGNRPTLLGDDSADTRDVGATWGDVVPSPDGRSVAATRHADGHWSLVRWPAEAPEQRELLFASRSVVSDVAWTPNGELLFVSDQSGYPQIYRWSASGAPVALTAEPLGARAPAMLADSTLLYTTVAASGWELRHARPDSGVAAPPLVEPLPFDSAPATALRETGYALGSSLRPHFWLPLVLDRGSAGTFFGVATGGTDAVERYTYAVAALASASPGRMVAAFDGVSHLFGNPSLDVSLTSDWAPVASPDTSASQRESDAALGVTFVARRWETTASLRVAAEYEATHFAACAGGCVDQSLLGASITLAVRSFTFGAVAISPEDGVRLSATYRRWDERGTDRWSSELRPEIAVYAPLPLKKGFAHQVLALRVAAGALSGSLPRVFNVGGVSSGGVALALGQSLGQTRDFPVRGYAEGELWGDRAIVTSVEYRVPLALIGQLIGHLPIGSDKVSLSLFADAGSGWTDGNAAQLARLRSVGAELVGDMTISYDAPLRLRLGVAKPLAPPPSGLPQDPVVYVALSSSF